MGQRILVCMQHLNSNLSVPVFTRSSSPRPFPNPLPESRRQDQRNCQCGVVGGPTRPLFPRALDDGSLRCNVTKLSNHSREDIVIHTRYGFEESGRQDQRICRCGVVGGPTRPLFPRALDDGSPRCNVTKLSNHSREDKVLHTHRQSPNGKWQIIAYL